MHQLRVEVGTTSGEIEHDILEALALLVLRGPEIPDVPRAFGANLHRLFQVGIDYALSVNFGSIMRVAQLLAAVGDVATIGLGTSPGQAVFLVLRARKEQFGMGERFGNCGRRNPIVLQIDKTRSLERVGDMVGNRLLIRRCTVEERTKVDELANGSAHKATNSFA